MSFCRCDMLEWVEIPSSVVSVDSGFRFNPNLKKVYLKRPTPFTGAAFQDISIQSTLFVPTGCKDNFSNWSDNFGQIREADFSQGIENLNHYDFKDGDYCFNILSETNRTCEIVWGEEPYTITSGKLELPSQLSGNGKNYTVTSVGKTAFAKTSGIINAITIPASITYIDENAFIDDHYSTVSTLHPKQVYALGATPPSGLHITGAYHSALFMPKGAKDAWVGWGDFSRRKEVDFSNGTDGLISCDFMCHDMAFNIISETDKTCAVTWADTPYNFSGELYIEKEANGYVVTAIENGAFRGCTGITSLSMPSYVTSIGSGAFAECTSLSKVVIPPLVKTLDATFQGCTALESVTLGENVETLNKAFSDCPSIRTIRNLNITPPTFYPSEFYWDDINSVYNNATVLVNQHALEFYRNHGLDENGGETNFGWHLFKNIVADPDQTFKATLANGMNFILFDDGTATLTSSSVEKYTGNITVPSQITIDGKIFTVNAIGSYAFYKSTGLTSITIPASVTTVGINAFNGCSSLSKLTIEEAESPLIFQNEYSKVHFAKCPLQSVHIGRNTNMNIQSLESLVSVTAEGKMTKLSGFDSCRNLTSLTIAEGVDSIDGFNGTMLSNVSFPASTTSIKGFDKTPVKLLNLPAGLKYIDGFNGTQLSSVMFPESTTYIGGFDKTPVKLLNLPAGLKYINGFNGCTELTSVDIPDNVSFIGGFNGCTSITNVRIGKKVKGINGFYQCNAKEIIIGSSVTYISEGSFLDGSCSHEKVWFLCPEPPFGSYFQTFCKEVYIPLGSLEKYRENSSFAECNLIEADLSYMETYDCKDGDVFVNLSSTPDGKCTITSGDAPYTGDLIIPSSINYDGESYEVTVIGTNAFADNKELTGVTVPNTVTTVCSGAFSGCSGLNKLHLGNSVSEIDMNAFSGCSNITEIYSMNSVAPGSQAVKRNATLLFEQPVYEKATLYVPIGSTASYLASPLWNGFRTIVETESSGIEVTNGDTNGIMVNATCNTIVVNGVPSGKYINVYATDGRTISSTLSDGESISVAVPSPGIYIMEINGTSTKVVCR